MGLFDVHKPSKEGFTVKIGFDRFAIQLYFCVLQLGENWMDWAAGGQAKAGHGADLEGDGEAEGHFGRWEGEGRQVHTYPTEDWGTHSFAEVLLLKNNIRCWKEIAGMVGGRFGYISIRKMRTGLT